ncbi:hypothetical protein [Staphylococcus felis]|uniref:hypothetical protein n=1 Tax=Staphylococcus felis TaxID=46127 RepID=UPI002481883D|nr:hypothetical protein [Staphylococcus felis]
MDRSTERYFLIEVDREGNEYILAENYNGAGFTRTTYVTNAKTFKSLDEVKEGQQAQTFMNKFFKKDVEVKYVHETIMRKVYNSESIEEVSKQTTEELLS